MSPDCYVIIDPYHVYAAHLVQLLYARHGLRAVCVYTDRLGRFHRARHAPTLPLEAIAASFEDGSKDWTRIATRIAGRFRPAAVIPFSEETLGHSAELAHALGVEWAPLEVLRRFRDKFALKEHLRRVAPTVRMNASRIVRSAEEVHQGPLSPRFVLKPIDGHSNRHIGFFRADEGPEPVKQFISRHSGIRFVLEEYIDGTEYFVNGQTDAAGDIRVLAVFEYQRVHANGRESLDFHTRRVASHEPVFSLLERYAIDVLKPSGLRRSPFHMEIKVDAQGPCLIEVGARLAGNANAFVCTQLHEGEVDLFKLSLEHYLFEQRFGAWQVDWRNYDARSVLYAHGIAHRDELIWDLQGVEAVEALPTFAQWISKPYLGQRVRRTVDLSTAPWVALFQHRGPEEVLRRDAQRGRDLLSWNRVFDPMRRARVELRSLGDRVSNRLVWMLQERSRPQK